MAWALLGAYLNALGVAVWSSCTFDLYVSFEFYINVIEIFKFITPKLNIFPIMVALKYF